MGTRTKKIIWKTAKSPSKPYIRPLPYKVDYVTTSVNPGGRDENTIHTLATSQYGLYGWLYQNDLPYDLRSAFVQSNNKALEKFDEEVARVADVLVAAVEARSSVSELLIKPLNSLVSLAKGIRRGDPRLVRRAVNFHRKNGRDVSQIVKRPSGLWLAYWFGILPTISDIRHILHMFEADTYKSVTVRASAPFSLNQRSSKGGGHNYEFSGDVFTRIQADVFLVDSNRGLLAELGITSPLRAAYELVPWSWALDYFVNVGQLLGNYDGKYAGLEFQNVFTTTTCRGGGTYWLTSYGLESWDWQIWNYSQKVTTMNRVTSLPSFKLEFAGLSNLSGQRVSYLLAALSQQLKAISLK